MTFHTLKYGLRVCVLNLIAQKDYFVSIHIWGYILKTRCQSLTSVKAGYCIARKIILFIENGHFNTRYVSSLTNEFWYRPQNQTAVTAPLRIPLNCSRWCYLFGHLMLF